MTAFALVHGAWHGSWCWQPLIPALEAREHRALAVNLPTTDTAAGATRYRDVVLECLDGVEDDVVLVGHSLAGLTIPLVAAARPVRRMVFLCALIPVPQSSFVAQMAASPDVFVDGFDDNLNFDENRRTSWWAKGAARDLYRDCPEDVAAWAAPRLRPQASAPMTERCPLTAWPDVSSTYIVCRDDGVVAPAWSRREARRRLRLEPVELPGGHFPFLTDPDRLADLLVEVA